MSRVFADGRIESESERERTTNRFLGCECSTLHGLLSVQLDPFSHPRSLSSEWQRERESVLKGCNPLVASHWLVSFGLLSTKSVPPSDLSKEKPGSGWFFFGGKVAVQYEYYTSSGDPRVGIIVRLGVTSARNRRPPPHCFQSLHPRLPRNYYSVTSPTKLVLCTRSPFVNYLAFVIVG